MTRVVAFFVAVLSYIVALALAQFGPANRGLANWLCVYGGLLVLVAILPFAGLQRYAKFAIVIPAVLLFAYAIAIQK